MKRITSIILTFIIIFIAPIQATAYNLAPTDTLTIQILNQKDLNTKQTVAPDGTISMPLLAEWM
jgi:protein involved in polysaccharide export with SLBB domain